MAGLDSNEDIIDLTHSSDAKQKVANVKKPEDGRPEASIPTVLDDLKQSLSVVVQNEEITLRVPARPALDLVFDPNIEYGIVRKFYKQAETKDGVNQLRLAYTIIAWTNVGIRVRGVLAEDSKGDTMTVKNAEFQRMIGGRDTENTIYLLYGEKSGEGHLINVADRILEAAGYGDPRSIGLDPLDG